MVDPGVSGAPCPPLRSLPGPGTAAPYVPLRRGPAAKEEPGVPLVRAIAALNLSWQIEHRLCSPGSDSERSSPALAAG